MSIRTQNEIMALRLRCDDFEARLAETENRLELLTDGLEEVQRLLQAVTQGNSQRRGKAA